MGGGGGGGGGAGGKESMGTRLVYLLPSKNNFGYIVG